MHVSCMAVAWAVILPLAMIYFLHRHTITVKIFHMMNVAWVLFAAWYAPHKHQIYNREPFTSYRMLKW